MSTPTEAREAFTPHRPDIKPGRGYRILNIGETVITSDEKHLGKKHWGPVSDVLIGKPASCNFVALRRALQTANA